MSIFTRTSNGSTKQRAAIAIAAEIQLLRDYVDNAPELLAGRSTEETQVFFSNMARSITRLGILGCKPAHLGVYLEQVSNIGLLCYCNEQIAMLKANKSKPQGSEVAEKVLENPIW